MSLIPGFARRAFEASLAPLAGRLVAWRVKPNTITTIGTLVLVAAAVAYGADWVPLGGALLLLSGLFDMLDGQVARRSDRVTRFGAFYDSTLDRIGEAALFGGITVYFARSDLAELWKVTAVAVSVVALGAGLIVSYARARAEGLGLDCKVGIAQRAERVLGLGVPSLFFGAGPGGMVLMAVVAVLAATSVITVGQRIAYVRRVARDDSRKTQVRWPMAAVAEGSWKRRSGD